jgi:hypothetical protein
MPGGATAAAAPAAAAGASAPAASAPAAGAGAGAAAGGKESEASKRARRRAAQKANKKALREADEAQAAKFAKGAADSTADAAEGGERKEVAQDGEDAAVKTEGESKAGDASSSRSAAAIAVEVVPEEAPLSGSGSSDAVLAEMAEVFARFRQRGEEASGVRADEGGEEDRAASKTPHAMSKEERIDDELRQQSGETSNGDGGNESLSRRKQKQRDRLAISDLKLLVSKPEVVELHDANAADPKLLVYLKSYRNAVPVPMHWAQKRKYLQNKRGYEKGKLVPFNHSVTSIESWKGVLSLSVALDG